MSYPDPAPEELPSVLSHITEEAETDKASLGYIANDYLKKNKNSSTNVHAHLNMFACSLDLSRYLHWNPASQESTYWRKHPCTMQQTALGCCTSQTCPWKVLLNSQPQSFTLTLSPVIHSEIYRLYLSSSSSPMGFLSVALAAPKLPMWTRLV